MGEISFQIAFEKNEGLIMSPFELLEQYFYGIEIKNADGTEMADLTIKNSILAAQQEMENFLNIKFTRQIIEEDLDFYRDDFENWGFLRTTYLVNEVYGVSGYIGTIRQLEYPPEWLSIKRSNKELYSRHIYIVPNHNTVQTSAIVYGGITPHLGFMGNSMIPNYWKITYCTGFKKLPGDLWNFTGKLAAMNLFHVMGDLILGAGIANQSISIDGLSQSIGTTSSATNAGYGSRIIGYIEDLKNSLPRIINTYKGIPIVGL